MFSSVERRLAILNVSVVVAVVALIGIGTWIMLGQSLEREANASLESRIDAARASLDNLPSMAPGNQGPNAGQGQERRIAPTTAPETGNESDAAAAADDEDERTEGHDEDEEAAEISREILVSGDTLLYFFDDNGNVVTNRREVTLRGIPDPDSLDASLRGEIDTRIVTVDGQHIRVRTEPVRYEGEVVGAIQAARSEKEHDEELELVRTMTLIGSGVGVIVAVPAGIYLTRRAMAPINDVLHRQRAFVSDASHELRTPLTVLRANAEVLARTPSMTREEIENELQAMIGDIDGMAYLINELLQLSRVDNPDYTVAISEMELQPAIDRAIAMLRPQAEAAGVRVESSGAPLRVRGNPDLVGQVIRILLDNAIKYTPRGGEVHVTTHRDEDEAVIDVRDTGIGIQPEDLPYVFDRFYRADKARTRSTGSGLGLPIARGILTLLGGTITLESAPGEGTTVRITLPTSPAGHASLPES